MSGRLIAVVLALAFTFACTRPPTAPDASGSTQNLPFDRQSSTSGVSPTQSFVPAAHRIPEGTLITVRLSKGLSSTDAKSGDDFEGTLDNPVVVDDQTLLPRGAQLTGRVLDAKPSAPSAPGYLRITLLGIQANGRKFPVETSSIFAKAAPHPWHPSATAPPPTSHDVSFTPDRRLTFRLAQALDLE